MEHIQKICSAVILIGGESSRVNYPKHNLKYNNIRFLDIIESALSPLDVKYSTHTKIDDVPTSKQIFDLPMRIGPINGIFNSLDSSTTNFTLITSCDLPLLSNEVVMYMLGQAAHYNKTVIAEVNGQLMPTFGIYKTADKALINLCIENQDYALHTMLESLDFVKIKIPSLFEKMLTNVNTINDLEKIQPYIFSVCGYKNSGKTTMICKLINKFHNDGYTVSVLKHDGHDFDININTDTGLFVHNKAERTTIYSEQKYQSISLSHFDIDLWLQTITTDIVIIEGLKNSNYPKIIVESDETLSAPNVLYTVNKNNRDNIDVVYTHIRKDQNERFK